jgi:hypothetical protein
VKFVYGSNLPALQYAVQNNATIILGDLKFPSMFEPSYVHESWSLLYTKLLWDGQNVGGDGVKKVKVGEEKLSIVCEGNLVVETSYDSLCVFSDKDIVGLPSPTAEAKEYEVVDCMRPVSLKVPTSYSLVTGDDFVSAIHIRKRYKTDPAKIFVVSKLTEEQLNHFDYSDTMARFKTEDLLVANGFEGVVVGPRRRPVSLEVNHREVVKGMDHYESTEKIKFFHGS